MTMGHKSEADRKRYFEILRRMTPEQRLEKAIELSEMTKELLKVGLRTRYPEADEQQLHTHFLKRLARCHNRNY